MKIYHTDHTDPYFNLAAEEYLLDNTDGELFMLWRNEPAVIIGHSQNAYAELNLPFIREHGIKVVRRLTGGGAVFHRYLGNVNYTCISPRGEVTALDFAHFAAPVITALRKLGVDAALSGRNDIAAVKDGETRKISGNAQCVRNASYMKGEKTDKILHHGTLLYSADLSYLAGALNVDPEKMASKGIKSVRARVGNIRDYVAEEFKSMDAVGFRDFIESCFDGELVTFTPEQESAIQSLADTVYSTWEHNYGESKTFAATRKKRFPFGSVQVGVESENGVITRLDISGDFFGVRDIGELCAVLIGKRCEYGAVEAALSGVGDYMMGAGPGDIAGLIV